MVYRVCVARIYTHVIAFRTSASEHRKLQELRSTFVEPEWGQTMRWLFDQPEVQDVINAKLGDPIATPPVGIEASLPIGDR